MKRYLGAILASLFLSHPALAATLSLDPAFSSLERGQAEIVAVRLDTDEAKNECVNAVEGVITLSGPVSAVDISRGSSIFPIWVEPPTISQNGKEVTFAGGIPNGYCGRIIGDPRLTNTLFEIIVRSVAIAPTNPEVVTARIAFSEQTKVYLNDGFGTEAEVALLPKEITVQPNLTEDSTDPWKELVSADTIEPQEFSIELVHAPTMLNGRYYITFNTSDKQTGIDRYEVMEESMYQFNPYSWGRADAPWVEARSPYILKDQNLNSVIRVKAVDKAGNEYIATYVPDEAMRTTPISQMVLMLLLGVSVLILAYGVVAFYRRTRRIKAQQALEQTFAVSDESNEMTNITQTERNTPTNHDRSY